ncbi:hypothetical protein H310_06730 [Aphanomyces invadans]|uniref:Uncharacterized protein n=1 Tax=Aphanomyces invadans TaxID=157072 RepID=A0A024U4F3_9STRA|nr:hypothetical protein H310_06730 [Aphanomyces invadans]ETW01115.1 hypothetical protein H310_06730 [Aphanomyces invadans]|eukprot:XP_008870113.1 hypothetical protein H310_06730 [Aphanomyces invadans]
MSARRRNIRLEEYASTGAVTRVVVESDMNEAAPCKKPPRYAAASSHKDNEAYLAAFDNDPRLPRLDLPAASDDATTTKATSVPLPMLVTSTPKANVATDGSSRAPWLRGPSDSSGYVEPVSSQPLTCMSLAPDMTEVVVGSCDHALYAIPLQQRKASKGKNGSGVRTLYSKTAGHGEWVTAVAHMPDGRVVSGGMDSKLCLWDSNNRCEDLTGHAGSISLIRPFTENWIVSASYDKTYRLWDGAPGKRAAKAGRERHCLKGHDAPILDFSLWGNRLIGGDRNGSVLVFDLAQHAVERKAKGVHIGHCTAVLGSQHNSDHAFSGGQDGLLRMWDARSKDAVMKVSVHVSQRGTGAVSFIKDVSTMDHVIVTGGADGKVQVVDVRASNVRSTFSQHTTFIYSVHVDHELCFSGSGSGMLLVHDLRTDALQYGLGANQAAVRAIATTATTLAAAGDDGGVLVYEMT